MFRNHKTLQFEKYKNINIINMIHCEFCKKLTLFNNFNDSFALFNDLTKSLK